MVKNNPPAEREIALQSLLRPAFFPSVSSKDCRDFQDRVQRLDGLIRDSNLEKLAMDLSLEGYERASDRQRHHRARVATKALRTEALRVLLGNPSFRVFTRTVGNSDLLATFCGAREIDGIRGVARSTLERNSKFFSKNQIRKLHEALTAVCGNPDMTERIGMEEAVNTSDCLFDSTCIEANIHFPVDWVLLRDVAGTLLQATSLIREAGVRNRLPGGTKELMRRMNRMCIEMTHSGKCGKDSRNKRKEVFRKMKHLLRNIGRHAKLHRDLFVTKWTTTYYTEKEADRIVKRINGMLDQLPEVVKQAHERIVGERQVQNHKKILSVYEENIHVIKRGKAGRNVEFGNTLMLCEGLDGYILDWEFYKDQAPGEAQQMQESLSRQGALNLPTAVESACSDRGFNSKENSEWLNDKEIYDATCPRSPADLKRRMKESRFVNLQGRRGSTEGRIGIFKNRFQSGGCRAKGFEHRSLSIAWAVLGHNLWMLARRLAAEDAARQRPARAA